MDSWRADIANGVQGLWSVVDVAVSVAVAVVAAAAPVLIGRPVTSDKLRISECRIWQQTR